MATRLPDWRARFVHFIDRVKRQRLEFGVFDCGVPWAGELVRELTGEDPAALYRGRYHSSAGALSLLRRHKHADLAALVSAHLTEWPHPSAARLGDLVAVPNDSPFGYALGICNGASIFVLRENGVGTMDRSAATRAWQVGDA